MKANFCEMEENTSKGRTRRISKELVGCFLSVVGKKRLVVQF